MLKELGSRLKLVGLKEWRNKADGQGLDVRILAALWNYSKKGKRLSWGREAARECSRICLAKVMSRQRRKLSLGMVLK